MILDQNNNRNNYKGIIGEYIGCIMLDFQLSLLEEEKHQIIKDENIFEYFDDQCVMD